VIKIVPIKKSNAKIRKKTDMNKLVNLTEVQRQIKNNEKMMSIVVSPKKSIDAVIPVVPTI